MAEKKAKWPGSRRVPTTILLVPRRHVSRAHLVKLFALGGTSSILPRREPFFTLYQRRGGEANGKTGDFSSNKPGQFTPETPASVTFCNKTKRNSLTPHFDYTYHGPWSSRPTSCGATFLKRSDVPSD